MYFPPLFILNHCVTQYNLNFTHLCPIRSRSMALLSQQSEFDEAELTTISYSTWIGLKSRWGRAHWSDGTNYYSEGIPSSYNEYCAYISPTSHR